MRFEVVLQGLYEYVRPAWETRPRPASVELDLKTFGATIPSRPTLDDGSNKGQIPKYLFHIATCTNTKEQLFYEYIM